MYLTGGIDTKILGIPLRSRDPFRAVVASVLLFAAGRYFYPGAFSEYIAAAIALARRYAAAAAIGIGLLLAAHGIAFGSFGNGGADSYGYVNQAYEWKSGLLPEPIPIALNLELPFSDEMQAPLGYRVGPTRHTIVPTYAPGLPLIMAVTLVAGPCGPYFVTPVCAFLLVWFTYLLGERGGGRITGLVAALLVAVTPVVLYQALWPMSDVPAGALWTGALAFAPLPRRRHAIAAAACAMLGLLVRPNLLPLALVPLVALLFARRGWQRWVDAAIYGAPLLAVTLFVAWLNTIWYGAPSNTGYGATREIYLASNIWPNVKLYLSWLRESESPWALVALLPFVPGLTRFSHRPTAWLCAAACAATFACYVMYSQFEVWWYLRFLIPAAGAFAALLAMGFVSAGRALPRPTGAVVSLLAVWFMTATALLFAWKAGVFGALRAGERRYIDVGEFVAKNLPRNAALFSGQHSGSLRFYSGRISLRFDWVTPEIAGKVLPEVERAGYHPYLVVDDFEQPQVRQQFGFPEGSVLPWAIVARMREVGGLTVFDMAAAPGTTSPVALEPGGSAWCEARHPPLPPPRESSGR